MLSYVEAGSKDAVGIIRGFQGKIPQDRKPAIILSGLNDISKAFFKKPRPYFVHVVGWVLTELGVNLVVYPAKRTKY